MPGMLGDDQAVGESAAAVLEHVGRLSDCVAVLEGKRCFVQKTADREQLLSLVLVEGRA